MPPPNPTVKNNGIIIAAPTSASGKTTVTLGLLRALSRRGDLVRGAKSGPDYIDTRFHQAACGLPCPNLDAWAMGKSRLNALAQGSGTLIIEGAMGLFDGAPPKGKGSTADLARQLKLPVVLVVDGSHMAQSVTPLVAGFARHDPTVEIAGIILNRLGSPRHELILREAVAPLGIPVIGAIARHGELHHPSRHLGLVPAGERHDLETYLTAVAGVVEAAVDLDTVLGLARPLPSLGRDAPRLAPPAQSIAIARDAAFLFAYPHLMDDWHAAGAELSFFSPLNDEKPAPADLVFLPGGYPELHAERLANAQNFRQGMTKAAKTAVIYGECGGYMAMGETLCDARGKTHPMLGLLPLETSFAKRKLHLGYRRLTSKSGPFCGDFNGHEFHYASTIRADGPTLFQARDANANALPGMGLRNGASCGSFAHIIDLVL